MGHSNYSFANLLADADGLADNLADYIDRFSPDVDVFDYFDFKKEILALEKAELPVSCAAGLSRIPVGPQVGQRLEKDRPHASFIVRRKEAVDGAQRCA